MRLRLTGPMVPVNQTLGRERIAEMVDVEEAMLDRINEDHMVARTREIAKQVGESH